MTVISDSIRSVSGVPDDRQITFACSVLRDSGGGDAIVSTRFENVTPVDGEFSIDLDPGPAEVVIRNQTFKFVVPDSGPSRLWPLIEDYVPVAAPVVNAAVVAKNAAVAAADRAEAVSDVQDAAIADVVVAGETKAALDASYAPVSVVAAVGTKLTQSQVDARVTAVGDSTYAPKASPTFTGTVTGVTKAHVGLGSVDNTADTAKPVSTAQQTALDAKLSSSTAATTYVPLSGDATLSGVKTFSNKVASPRLEIGDYSSPAAEQGLILSNRPGIAFDTSRRLGYVFDRDEHTISGSSFLVIAKKDGTATSMRYAIEGEVGTSAGTETGAVTGATAGRLGGVQGLVRHRSSASLPWGAGLVASVQVDSAANSELTKGHGVYVVPPEKSSDGGKIDSYYGGYIAGASDTVADALHTLAVPHKWIGLFVGRGSNDGLTGALTRAIWAEGLSVFRASSAGDPVIEASVDAEAFARMTILSTGQVQIGGGSAAADVTLARRAAKVLETPSTAVRVGNFATGADIPGAATAGRGAIAVQTDAVVARGFFVSDGTNWQPVMHGGKRGVATFSGDGSTVAFTIPHTVNIGTPVSARVTPGSSAAKGVHWISTLNATNIIVTFDVAPASGTNNVVLYWDAIP